MKGTNAGQIIPACVLLFAGYLGFDSFAYRASDRMSNGYHPVAFFGALLELGAALWLVFFAARQFLHWRRQMSTQARAVLLGACVIANTFLVMWTLHSLQQYKAQMPEVLGSFFRFYFTPIPLWVCAASFLATILTLIPLDLLHRNA